MAEQLELENTPEGGDIRSDIAAAMESAEKAEAPIEVQPVQESKDTPADTEQPKEGRDEKGRFAKKDDEKAPAVDSKAPPVDTKAPAAPEVPKAPAFATDGAKPPSSWRPAAREHFAALPKEVQDEAIRVDREVRRTMQESAEARQAFQKLKETFQPYEPMLRAQGVDPFQFSANMAQTVAALATGPQQTKAEIVANVIKTYGVDLATLAAVLDGTPAPAVQQQQPYRDPRVDELLQTVEQAKAQREQMLTAKAQTEIREIENEEFFWDVKDDMADLLDLAANRNLALTPREAYNRAILMHPEISRVTQQRQAALAAANPTGSTQRARAAASSPRASPASVAPPSGDRNLRDEIAAAWDANTQSR